MINYNQKDKRWKDLKISKTDLTLGEYGCFVVALAMLDGRTPDIILDILNRNQCFNHKGMLLSDLAAKALGLKYKGKKNDNPNIVCIAETNHYANLGIPQHFFVWLGDGRIIDPLDGLIKLNPYHIVSFRMFEKKIIEPTKEIKAVKKPIIQKGIIKWDIDWIMRIFQVLKK
jgi:hypothetical protein